MFLERVRRILKKPLSYILWRLFYEAKAEIARFWEPLLPWFISEKQISYKFGAGDVSSLWKELSEKDFFTPTFRLNPEGFEKITGHSAQLILQNAEKALNHTVTLLGLKDAHLGNDIDWGKDYRINRTWSNTYFRSIDYINFDTPSDVKIPWEISRMQWMIPLGQAYMLTGDEKYAEKTKALILDWIQKNPFAKGVNWACTMEVAIRIVVLCWFFHVFKNSQSWTNTEFKGIFLKNIYLHANFTARHLEKSDINGNHYIADAMGLVFAGVFFGLERKESRRWMDLGWIILCDELQKQVYEDGVDYEGSIHYHRLVFEIFYFSAQYARQNGVTIPDFYDQKLVKMVDFVAHYTQPNGLCPLVGDNDDARILPFGVQEINDHRYVVGLAAIGLGAGTSIPHEAMSELFWNFSKEKIRVIENDVNHSHTSKAFPVSGYYVMREGDNHIFINCARMGLVGRGGHSHNDALSFEAVLEGEKLITDAGSFVYTADYKVRNTFRSIASHNTPYIKGVEMNVMPGEKLIWSLENEAKPRCLLWEETDTEIMFQGEHLGYQKLTPPLSVKRKIILSKTNFSLKIIDEFQSDRVHDLCIPFHFDEGVVVSERDGVVWLKKNTKEFRLKISTPIVHFEIHDSWCSKNYGVKSKTQSVIFKIQSNQFFELEILPKKLKGESDVC